jgi:hypothetical protein
MDRMLTQDLHMVAQLSPLSRYVLSLGTWWEIEDLIQRLRKSINNNDQPELTSEIQERLTQLHEPRKACYQGFLAAAQAARTWLKKEHRLDGIAGLRPLELAPMMAKYVDADQRGVVLAMAAQLLGREHLGKADWPA